MHFHDAFLFLVGIALGWVTERALRRARRGRKRGRAIPKGTERAKRQPRAKKPAPATGEPLGLD
jgi:hypothetical protein